MKSYLPLRFIDKHVSLSTSGKILEGRIRYCQDVRLWESLDLYAGLQLFRDLLSSAQYLSLPHLPAIAWLQLAAASFADS